MELGTTSFVGCFSLWSVGDLGVVLSKWGWGWSLVGWFGVLSLVGFLSLGFLLLLCAGVAHLRGSTPLEVGVFPWFLIHLVFVFGLLSKTKHEKSNNNNNCWG